MANNCSITLKADKLPKVISKVEYFLFKAMEQTGVDFFQVAENPAMQLASLLPVARTLIDSQIKDYIKKSASAVAKGNQDIADDYEVFAANLQNITANWNQVSASISVYSSIFKTKTKFKLDEDGMVDLSELADDEEAIYKKFIVDQAANEIDPFDTIDKAVEIFIRSIPRDALIPDEYGFKSNIDYSYFVRNLMADLEGSIGIEEIIAKLEQNKEKTPEYQYIIDMLQFSPSDNSRQLQLKINFRNSFAKANIPIYTTSVEGNVIKVFEATVARRSKYEQTVESNFVLRGMPVTVNGETINLAHQEDGVWTVDNSDVEKIKKFLDKNLVPAGEMADRKIQFLKAIGFSFSPVTEERLKKTINDSKPFNYIYNHFVNRISQPSTNKSYGPVGQTDVITNPIASLKKDWNKFGTGQNNVINNIIELELKYNPTYNIERSVINPEGNRQHSTQLNNNFTVVNKFLSDADTYPTLQSILENEPSMFWLNPKTNPTIKESILFNSLFFLDPTSEDYGKRKRVYTDKTGAYRFSATQGVLVKLSIVNTGGLQLKADGNLKEDAASSTGLNEADKLLQDINMFMKAGFSSIIRLSDKTTDLGLFANFYADPVTGQPFKRVLGSLEKEQYKNIFTSEPFINGILKGLKDIISAKYLGKKGFYSDLDFASKNILNTWGEFDKVLSKDTKSALNGILDSDEITSVEQAQELINDPDVKLLVQEDVKEYFKKYSEEFLSKLAPVEKMVETRYLTGSGNFKDTVNYYLASTFLMDLETMKLFFGSSLHFKDFHKRASKDSATGNFTFLESSLIEMLNDYENAQGYGVNTNLSARMLAERLFQQNKITKDQRDQIIARQVVSKEFRSGIIQDVEFNSKQSEEIVKNIETLYSEGHISDENYELFKNSIKGVIQKKYTGKEADGQGYVTFDFYRTISILTNNWGEKQEAAYKKIVEYSHYNDLAEAETDETKRAEYIIKRDAVGYDPAEQVYFPPKKFQYTGPMEHEKVIDGNLYNSLVPVFDKFSLYPLIPTVIKGTENEDLAKRMEFEGVGYVKFKSGSKTETPKKQDSLYVNYDENNAETRYIKTFEQRVADGDTKFLSEHVIYMNHLKEQVRIDAEVHEDVIFGSQARKLILMNLLSLTSTHNRTEFLRLYNQYKGLITDLIQIEKTVIYNRLGIKVNKEGVVEVKDISKLVEYFTKEISKKNQDSNVLKALQYDEATGNFKIPLDGAVQAQIIEGIMISSINNNIVRYKASGSMLTQVSVTGSGAKVFSKDASQKALETFGNKELKYHTIDVVNGKRVVTAIDVKIGLTEQWLPLLELNHPDGNKIGSIDRLNESIKNKEWKNKHRNSIRMISYRIPTQGRNFIKVMEVAEFLPAQFGDAIIAPSEVVIQDGSDFDIDKLFVFYPNLSKDGTYLTAEYTKNDLNMPDSDLLRGAIQNRLYETMAEIILHPNNYMELVTPSDSFHIDPIVNALYKKLGLMDKDATERPKTDYKHTDILDRNRNIEKFLSLLNGKSDLGIAALANTFNVLYQIAEAKGNPEFFKNKSISSFFSSKFMGKNKENIIQSIYYGDIYDEDGVLKSEFFSEFISAFVDVAKDDYVFGINVVTEFSPMIFYMKFSGLSSKKILAFINQPILRSYVKNLSKYENMFVQNYMNEKKIDLERLEKSYTAEEKQENEEYKTLQDELKGLKNSARKKALAETLREFGFTDVRLGNPPKAAIKKALGDVDYTDQFTAKNLFNNIRNVKTFKPSQLSEDQKNFQLAVLYEMLNQKEQSDSMTNAQRFLNFDTKPYVSTYDVYVRNINYQEAAAEKSDTNVLSPETLRRIKKDSIISPLDVGVEIRTLLETLLPVRNNKQLNGIIFRKALELRADFENKSISSEEDMLRFSRTAKNDFMTYILQNFFDKSEKGKAFFKETFGTEASLNDYLKQLIETDKLRTQLLNIRNLPYYNDLIEKYPIVESIVVQPGANNKNIVTYRFLENSNNPVEKQSMILQFEELAMLQSEEDKLIRDFFRDLALYSVFQSGYNTSDISYTGITPIDIINPLYAAAIEEFEKLTPADKFNQYDSFFYAFAKNNPGFYSTKKSTDTITGEISKRGKWYANVSLNVKRPEAPKPKVQKKVVDNNMELKMQPYNVELIKRGVKKVTSRNYRMKNGVYKLSNPEGVTAFVQVQFYKQISALDLDTQEKKESYAKNEGFTNWSDLESRVKTGKTVTLKPGFLTGAQKVNVYLLKYLPEGSKSVQTPVSQTNKPKGEEVKEGIYVNQEALTKEEQLELFNYLKPYLEEQAAKTNKGAEASKMIGLGLRWDYKSNNPGKQAVNIPDVIQPGNKDKFGYYNTSINGQPLGQITSRFRELMEKATGLDMTHYDGAIVNLYDNKSFISTHNDVDESRSAINYPVIGINLGGTGNFSIESRDGSPKQLNLKAGTAYIFGVDGINREVFHRTFAGKQDSFLPKLTTKLDGKTYEAGSYRVTITMRRVLPLTQGMPNSPSVNTSQTLSANPLVQAGVKPTDMKGNASKDIQMAKESTQFIGFKSGNAKVSSTDKYKQAWGDRANTGNYSSKDIIMVSGSGTWRGVTADEIRKTLTEKYKPLLEKAIAVGASFRVGNQYTKGNLSDELIAKYLQQKGYKEEKLDGYSRWTLPLVKPTSGITKEQAIEEYGDDLIYGVNLRSKQDKIRQGDEETILEAYSYLKAEEKAERVREQNKKEKEELKTKIDNLKKRIDGANQTKVGDVVSIYNDESASQFKAKVKAIEFKEKTATVTVVTAKNKEYTYVVDKDGISTKGTTEIENFVFESSGENKQELVEEYNKLVKRYNSIDEYVNTGDYWVDYSKTSSEQTSEEQSPVTNSAKIDEFRELLVESISMTNQEIEGMYEREKLSGEIMEEFLNRMYCLGKIK